MVRQESQRSNSVVLNQCCVLFQHYEGAVIKPFRHLIPLYCLITGLNVITLVDNIVILKGFTFSKFLNIIIFIYWLFLTNYLK